MGYGRKRSVSMRFLALVFTYDFLKDFESAPDTIRKSLRFAQYTGATGPLIEGCANARDSNRFFEMTPQQRMAPFWGTETYPEAFSADIEWRVPPEHVDYTDMGFAIMTCAYRKP